MKKYFMFLVILMILPMTASAQSVHKTSLAGMWFVKLDSLNMGVEQNWAAESLGSATLTLPGTLDDAAIGNPNTLEPALNNYVLSNLARKHQYIGKAWYQKEVAIPQEWKDKKIELFLERVIWESTVFVDGHQIGSAESLVGSHEFDLSEALSPGTHLLTICIDNDNKYPSINVAGSRYPDPVNQDMAHAYTNHTQIKWNGILGAMQLKVSEPSTPKNLKVQPDFDNNRLHISFEQDAPTHKNLSFEIVNGADQQIFYQQIDNPLIEGKRISFWIARPERLEGWDEFHPNTYTSRIMSGTHRIEKKFGYRKLENNHGSLTLNGKRIFLRGNLECVIFPLTGHPPMQEKEWSTLITQAKNYGLNHLRFHSWCPPEAAFAAADKAGFYLQAELPYWSLKVGEDEKTTAFLRKEAAKMINDYGHHPSFIFMALGNELQGDIELLNEMVAELKKLDDGRMYATTSFSFQKPVGTRPEPEDDFFITQWTEKGWIRGQGVFNDQSPSFNSDYAANSEHIKIPLISHEIGQYSVYPDVSEIPKYTGVLEPLNFVAVKNDLQQKGMLHLAQDFTQASGRLAAMLYKEEIERALKTPNFDGFQLLQLQDFPGQGTALVGLLNAFWESKDVISAEEFRQFNGPLVPLIRYEKAVYETGEIFSAKIEVANFLEEKKWQTIQWMIEDEQGNVLAEDQIRGVDLPLGNNLDLGIIKYPVNIEKAQQWNVKVIIEGTQSSNNWSVWVYPKSDRPIPKNVLITTSYDEAIDALDKGKNVLLNPDLEKLQGIKGRFVPVFWSPVHFPDQPGTMGLLVDERHQALSDFPTNFYTEWQWWDLCIHSKSVIIDSLHVNPIVRVIDNFVTNHQLANVFEAKVGNGKLLFASIDLHSDLANRPVARQLRKSLVAYMSGGHFDPSADIEASALKSIIVADK